MADKLTYKDAGVDTVEGQRAVSLMKEHVKKTFTSGVMTGLGSFGSLFSPDMTGIDEPVLVAGTDGVGTKLKIAFMMDKHDTVGQDCVAMCVNDILCQGAVPLFFFGLHSYRQCQGGEGRRYRQRSSRRMRTGAMRSRWR